MSRQERASQEKLRFLYQVDWSPTAGDCWLWAGRVGTAPMFYGWFGAEAAHRASYRIFKGRIPPGMCVCHTCDVPLCVRPGHLWLGTHSQNMGDASKKGRLRRQPLPAVGDGDGEFEAMLLVEGRTHRMGAFRSARKAESALNGARIHVEGKPSDSMIVAFGYQAILEAILNLEATVEVAGTQINHADFRRLVASVADAGG